MYFEQGNILFRIGNFEKALEKFSFAQRLDPDMGNLLLWSQVIQNNVLNIQLNYMN